jgi:hypothetical protein
MRISFFDLVFVVDDTPAIDVRSGTPNAKPLSQFGWLNE